MPKTDRKREQENAWQAEHMCLIGSKIRRETATTLRIIAARNNTTVSALIRGWVMEYIAKNERVSNHSALVENPVENTDNACG